MSVLGNVVKRFFGKHTNHSPQASLAAGGFPTDSTGGGAATPGNTVEKENASQVGLVMESVAQQPQAALSAHELAQLNPLTSNGVNIAASYDVVTFLSRIVEFGINTVEPQDVKKTFDEINHNYAGGTLLLLHSDLSAGLAFVAEVLTAWCEHPDWQGQGFNITASTYVQVSGFCWSASRGRYAKAFRLYKTAEGILGWGDSEFQRLLRNSKTPGVRIVEPKEAREE